MIEQTTEGWWVVSEDSIHATKGVKNTGRLDFDRLFIDAVRPFIKPNTIVLDIGANIGTHSYAYAQMGAHVFSFEPNPEPFSCLVKNCRTGTQFNVALIDKAGEMTMWVPSSDTGGAFLRIRGTEECPNSILKERPTVQCRTLDSVYDEHKESFDKLGVSYMKIDTEGSEPLMIRGGSRTITKFRPVIVVEVCYNTLWRLGFNADDILRPLIPAGYHIEDLPIPEPHRHDEHYRFNALCLP